MLRRNFLKAAAAALAGLGLVKPKAAGAVWLEVTRTDTRQGYSLKGDVPTGTCAMSISSWTRGITAHLNGKSIEVRITE